MLRCLFFILFLPFCTALPAAVTYIENNNQSIASQKTYKNLNITEIILKNGMKVILKSTDFEQDEIMIRISAKEGYASLDPKLFATGDLTAQMAWESGLGHWTADQVSILLYEHGMEIVPKIHPYSRQIEGSCDEDGLESYLELVNLFFMSHKFTREGFDEVLKQTVESISKRRPDFEANFDEAVKSVNTANEYVNLHLTLEDMKTIEFDKAKNLFESAFAQPSDFVCVIVGSFNEDAVKRLVVRYLGSIVKSEAAEWPHLKKTLSFPKGAVEKVVAIHTRADSLTRITFPLTVDLNEANTYQIELVCQIIEGRLRKLFREKMNTSYGVDVGYEFPAFPLRDLPWITIQYRSEHNKISNLNAIILKEIKTLESSGVTTHEIEEAMSQQNRSDEFWLKDNYFWVGSLSNYYLWEWNPNGILKHIDS